MCDALIYRAVIKNLTIKLLKMKTWHNFKTVTETHTVYPQVFDMYSIIFSTIINAIVKFVPIYTTTMTHQHWLWPAKFTDELSNGPWYQKVMYLVFHISHVCKSHTVSSGDLGGQGMGPAGYILVSLILETPFSFAKDQSPTQGWDVTIYEFLAVTKLFHICIYNRF
jgi:hypothetical protein